MINVYKSLSRTYYNNSRDFQIFGRVYELLLNYILTNVDVVASIPLSDNTPIELSSLLLYTLGFKQVHNYTDVDIIGLAKIFKYLVKNKGTKLAIETCIYLLLRSQNYKDNFKVEIKTLDFPLASDRSKREAAGLTPNNLYVVNIYLPLGIKDEVLIEDVFDYILPAGFIYNIYFTDLQTIGIAEESFISVDTNEVEVDSNSSQRFAGVYDSSSTNNNYTYNTVVVDSGSINAEPPMDTLIPPTIEIE